MYKKYNVKLLKKIKGEPFDVQTMSDGSTISLYSFNDQDSYNTYIAKNIYYVWACDGHNYSMLIDDEYYGTFQELFSLEANTLFINHLNRLLKYNFINKIVSYSVLGVVAAFLIISLILTQVVDGVDLGNASLYAVIGSLVAVLIVSFVFRRPQQKSLEIYRTDMRNLFGDEGIDNIVNKQGDFYASKAPKPVEEVSETDNQGEVIENGEPKELENSSPTASDETSTDESNKTNEDSAEKK
jgi:hypothetical protein